MQNRGTEKRTPSKVKLITQRLYEVKPEHFEHVPKESQTVPDDSMSVRELVSRFTRGQRIPDNLMRSTAFDKDADFDSPDIEEVSRMDIADRHEMSEKLKQQIAEKKLFLQQQREKQAAERERLRSSEAAGRAQTQEEKPEQKRPEQSKGRRTDASKGRASSGDSKSDSTDDY